MSKKRNSSPRSGYVNRPSQITGGTPSKRLRKRRRKNIVKPHKGFFPNPSGRNYVNRPSQITGGPPSKRLRKRRRKNVAKPHKGFFPNPATNVSGRPLLYKISARRGNGPKMHYDGMKFSQRAKVKLFSTIEAADSKARELVQRYPILRGYRLTIDSNF